MIVWNGSVLVPVPRRPSRVDGGLCNCAWASERKWSERGSWGRDGGAEEAGEQVQGAGRQAAAGQDPTPEHPDASLRLAILCYCRCAKKMGAISLRLVLGNVLRGCRQDMEARFCCRI